MSDQNPQPLDDKQLEDLLDGLLPEDQAEALLEQAQADDRLRGQVEAQQQIDAGLKRLGTAGPTEADRYFAMAEAEAEAKESAPTQQQAPQQAQAPADKPSPPPASRPLWVRVAAIAAVVALVGVGVWQLLPGDDEDQIYSRPQTVVMKAILKKAETENYKPDWLCKNDKEFRETFEEKLGQAVSMRPLPDDRRMMGLSYLGRGKGEGVYMLAKAKGKGVIVFFDKPELLKHYNMKAPEGMNLHRGKVGGIVIIEMSPLDEPAFIPYLTEEPQVWPEQK